jgi:hypothetical protein
MALDSSFQECDSQPKDQSLKLATLVKLCLHARVTVYTCQPRVLPVASF